MVALPRAVDVEKEAREGGSIVCIDDGRYPAVVISSELKQNSKGTGSMVCLKTIITSGKYKDTEFVEHLNIIHPKDQTVLIAMQTLANIGKAVGLASITDTNQLHNKPYVIEVKQKQRKNFINNDGEEVDMTGKFESVIVKRLPTSTGQAAHPAASSQQPQVPYQDGAFTPPVPQAVYGDAMGAAHPVANPFEVPK